MKREQAPKPPGRVRRAVRRRRARTWRAVRPYAFTLIAVAVAALVLRVAAPGLAWLALLAAGAVLGIGGDRLREHWGWHRSGGKAARRKRARWQGEATLSELHRKGHSLAGVRRNAKTMRPALGGHTRGLPPAEAGILIGTVKAAAR